MAKKGVKTHSHKGTHTSHPHATQHHEHHATPHPQHHAHHEHTHHETHVRGTPVEEAIVKNLVEIQKVHVDLAEKFDKLAKEISQLLGLFELTAKRFSSHAALGEYEKDQEFLEKIDTLLQQNKILAKGITLMEERLRERVSGSPAPAQQYKPQQFAPLPSQQMPAQQFRPPVQPQPPKLPAIEEDFQPSMASEEETSFPPASNKRPLPHV